MMNLSHTRGASLSNLAVFCFVLGKAGELKVGDMVNRVYDLNVLEEYRSGRGERLPTRVNHHVISLRQLSLATPVTESGGAPYRLTPAGESIYAVMREHYAGSNPADLAQLRPVWREVLVSSEYVREVWLRHFLPSGPHLFDMDAFLSNAEKVIIYRGEPGLESARNGPLRLYGTSGEDIELGELGRKEVFQGVREWTNVAYLTDDRLPVGRSRPFSHYEDGGLSTWLIESHPVRQWLDPARDLQKFRDLFDAMLDEHGGRMTMPEILVEFSERFDYSKANIKEMVALIYDHFGNRYFFERGSEFLIKGAYYPLPKDLSLDFYLQLDAVWRVGVVRY